MIRYVLPALFTLFIWWSSTAAIVFLYRRPGSFRWTFPLATITAGAALFGLWATRNDTSILAAYLAFVCGVAICGWHLLSYYSAVATGPRLSARQQHWPRLPQAIYASLYHELIGVALATLGLALTWNAPNQVGIGTFLLLWAMHQSARLNVLLGVRNFNVRMLPRHLHWIEQLLSKRTSNLYFPFSIIVTVSLTVVLALRALAPGASAFEAVGSTFLCLMMAMAFFEHALLMLPEQEWLLKFLAMELPPPNLIVEE